MPKPPLILLICLGVAVLAAGCGSRPEGVTRQFIDRMAALDADGMAQLVCAEERAGFRESVDFLRVVSDAGTVELQDFKARTERSDGTAITLEVTGQFVSAELGEMPASGRIRLLRDAGEWCISGERDGFRAISGIAGDLFALLIRGGVPSGGRFEDSPGGEWIMAEASTPKPAGPPEIDGEIVTTESGLRYVEIAAGAGETPEPGQTVVVRYTMWVKATGELIDKTVEGDPFEFVLGSGEVLDGFDEGVATMREGGRRRLTIPWRLGYKDDYVDGYGDNIRKNSTLMFDVELIEIR
jgi:peptidylprolyl isomerase